jgi:microcystin-dependent protein
MWSGLVGAIPSGWVICDGTNSTPNLTGKFIKAATTAGGTGGSATTGAHTLSTSEMPSHSHTLNQYVTGDTNHTGGGNRNLLLGGTWTTSSTGGGGSHTHTSEPEYFALIYIMKS